MSETWLEVKEVTDSLKINERTFYRRFKNREFDKHRYVESNGGGRGGKKLQIALSCLSPGAQARYWVMKGEERKRLAGKQRDVDPPSGSPASSATSAPSIITDLSHPLLATPDTVLIPSQNDDFETLPEYKKGEALRWLNILGDFQKYLGKRSRGGVSIAPTRAAEDFARLYCIDHPDDPGFGWRTLMRRQERYKKMGVRGLANLYGNTRNFAGWSPEAKAWVWQKYLNINAPTAAWCYMELKREARAKGWTIPSRATVLRYLKAIPLETQVYYREGEKAWREKFLPSLLRDYEVMEPGQIYVGDHAQINVAVRHPSGRTIFPWVSGWLDMRTRKVVGWELCETPNANTINIALKRAIEHWGLPRDIIIDNGRDYSSLQFSGKTKRFRFAVNEQELSGIYKLLGITAHFCIPANARAKNIERFFWTQEMHFQMAFPTYRGNNSTNRPEGADKRIRQGQALEWDEFKRCLENYLDHYNKEHQHNGHGMNSRSPDEVWFEYFACREQRRVSPVSLRLLMMKSRLLRVGRFGVRVLGHYYHSDPLMNHQGKSVVCRYDPDDVRTVFVYSDRDEYLCTAERLQRVAWNDENAYREIKSLEKRRRRALREEREAAERIAKVEFGYTMREPESPKDPEPAPKIIRLMRTPFDGVQKRIDAEGEQKTARAGGGVMDPERIEKLRRQLQKDVWQEQKSDCDLDEKEKKRIKKLQRQWYEDNERRKKEEWMEEQGLLTIEEIRRKYCCS